MILARESWSTTSLAGIVTQESRGMDITLTLFRSPLICMTIIVSVRWAPTSHWEGSLESIRESEPRTRKVTGWPAAPVA